MKDFWVKYRSLLLGFALVIVPFVAMYYHGQARQETSPVEKLLILATAPVTTGVSAIVDAVGDVWESYMFLVGVEEDNQALEKENAYLMAEALKVKKLSQENARLKDLLGFKKKNKKLDLVSAKVIGMDISPFFRVVRIQIEAGQSEGVAPGMPVLTHMGVVGRISKVYGSFSDVMLMVDSRSKIDAKIVGRGVTGTLVGKSNENVYKAKFLYLGDEETIEEGDTVVTSGHDQVFPPDLEIGYVANGEKHQSGLYYEFVITPAVNFSTLEEVMILKKVIVEESGGSQ